MKNWILFLFFIQTTLTFAQSPQTLRLTNGYTNMPTTNDRFQYINPMDLRNIELEGERYFYDSLYRPGELKTKTNFFANELTYRFDQIERTVQVKLDNGKQMFLTESNIDYFKLFIDDKLVTFEPQSVPNGRKLTMLQIIYKSPTLQLYRDVRKYIFRVKSDNNDGYGSNQVYDEIRKDYRYFFRKGDKGAFKELKIDAKSMIAAMPSKKAQINQFFRLNQSKGGMNVTKLAQLMAELDKSELKTEPVN
ncbi:MAG: hypothetical protein JNL70_23150 [Saprospiraceae bacterium]|nr:hypothetical protein [Saprospiraceae bacterium]